MTAKIPDYSLRSVVRPGITGWAQVRYAYANNLEEEIEKMRYDLYYIKPSYLEVCKVRALVRILGERWDPLEVIPNREIEAIQRVLEAGLPVLRHPYLRVGTRVRITRGPLADVEGILVRGKPNKGLLVLSIDLLRRAVAVEVDCTLVTAT